MLSRRFIPHAFLLLSIVPAILTGRAQAPASAESPLSKEAFVSAIFENIVDSSWSTYYLAAEAPPCSFVKYDYGEWVKYGLMEMVPIGILNELAKKSYEDRKPLYWEDGKLVKATCIGMSAADSVLARLTEGVAGAAGRHRKTAGHSQQGKAWSRLPAEEKEVFYFSRPVFTDDGAYAVIDLSYRCDARECGMGATYLFRQTAAGWKLVGKMVRWGA